MNPLNKRERGGEKEGESGALVNIVVPGDPPVAYAVEIQEDGYFPDAFYDELLEAERQQLRSPPPAPGPA